MLSKNSPSNNKTRDSQCVKSNKKNEENKTKKNKNDRGMKSFILSWAICEILLERNESDIKNKDVVIAAVKIMKNKFRLVFWIIFLYSFIKNVKTNKQSIVMLANITFFK